MLWSEVSIACHDASTMSHWHCVFVSRITMSAVVKQTMPVVPSPRVVLRWVDK